MSKNKPAENIHEAIANVMQEVGYVLKERKSGLNYSFASEAALIAAIRPHMVEQGITAHVSSCELISEDSYQTIGDKPKLMFKVQVKGGVTFTHVPSGTSFVAFAIGEGNDYGDKATGKAMTGMYKYALRQSFVIETGDDADKDSSMILERNKLDEVREEISATVKKFVDNNRSKEASEIVQQHTPNNKNNWNNIKDVDAARALLQALQISFEEQESK